MLPRLRHDLDLIPIEHEGRELVLVRDPLDLVKHGSAIEPSLLHLFQLLERGATIEDLQEALTRSQGGVFVSHEDCERLVAAMDSSFLLDTPAYRARRSALEQEYAALTVRPSSHAGHSYPAEAENVAAFVDSLLAAGMAEPPKEQEDSPLIGLIAPHIDIAVGGNVYGSAYASLALDVKRAAEKNLPPVERIVILGVGHKLTDSLYSVTPKDYETPLGKLRTDTDAVARLAALGPPVVSASDWAHRDEHSIEFPALFLQRIFGDSPDFQVVPVLCGSAQIDPDEYSRQLYMTHAARFVDALSRIVADDSRRTIVVASVDFCHIGPKFGHGQTGRTMEPEATAHDRSLLDLLAAGDAKGFWAESVRVMDRYNVCGFPAMATMLESLPAVRGDILGYAMHHEEATHSAVSYAAMEFRTA